MRLIEYGIFEMPIFSLILNTNIYHLTSHFFTKRCSLISNFIPLCLISLIYIIYISLILLYIYIFLLFRIFNKIFRTFRRFYLLLRFSQPVRLSLAILIRHKATALLYIRVPRVKHRFYSPYLYSYGIIYAWRSAWINNRRF